MYEENVYDINHNIISNNAKSQCSEMTLKQLLKSNCTYEDVNLETEEYTTFKSDAK